MTDSEPILRHVWLLDGRSLCDRRARPAELRPPTPEEFEAETTTTEAAPACTACMILAANVRREAAAILRDAGGAWPETASAAWASLAGTRWTQRYDVEEPDVPQDRLGIGHARSLRAPCAVRAGGRRGS